MRELKEIQMSIETLVAEYKNRKNPSKKHSIKFMKQQKKFFQEIVKHKDCKFKQKIKIKQSIGLINITLKLAKVGGIIKDGKR